MARLKFDGFDTAVQYDPNEQMDWAGGFYAMDQRFQTGSCWTSRP